MPSEKKLLGDYFCQIEEYILKIVQQYNYLIALSSFSLVIARFSADKYDAATEYAIYAAMFFLLSFFSQFLKGYKSEIGAAWAPTILSLCSLLAGFFYFFRIVLEYSKQYPAIGQVSSAFNPISIIIVMGSIGAATLEPLYIALKYLLQKENDLNLVRKATIHVALNAMSLLYCLIISIESLFEVLNRLDVYNVQFQLGPMFDARINTVMGVILFYGGFAVPLLIQVFFNKRLYGESEMGLIVTLRDAMKDPKKKYNSISLTL